MHPWPVTTLLLQLDFWVDHQVSCPAVQTSQPVQYEQNHFDHIHENTDEVINWKITCRQRQRKVERSNWGCKQWRLGAGLVGNSCWHRRAHVPRVSLLGGGGCAQFHNGYTWAYVQIIQHTNMHKVVTGRIEAKKSLSRQKQSECRSKQCEQNGWFMHSCTPGIRPSTRIPCIRPTVTNFEVVQSQV